MKGGDIMLAKEELMQIQGGANWLFWGGVAGGIISFLTGLFEGLMRPLACHN